MSESLRASSRAWELNRYSAATPCARNCGSTALSLAMTSLRPVLHFVLECSGWELPVSAVWRARGPRPPFVIQLGWKPSRGGTHEVHAHNVQPWPDGRHAMHPRAAHSGGDCRRHGRRWDERGRDIECLSG